MTWRTRLAQLEFGVLLLTILIAGGVWGFIELADLIDEEEAHPADIWMLKALRNPEDLSDPLGPVWVEEMMRDITALGSTGILAFITLSALGYLWIRGNRRTAVLLIVAVVGSYFLSLILKIGYARPRPDLVPRVTATFNPSFPSGHSMLSAAAYLTLGALLARVQRRSVLSVYILSLALIVAFAVGFSRIYLGVHWPSDVLAGWTAGAVWAMLVWLLARRVLRPRASPT